MGILAGGLMMIIDPAGQLKRSRDGQRKADLKQIQAGLELYRSDVGSYPANLNGTSLTNADGSITYIQTIPKDPKSPTTDYLYAQTGSGYTLTACNETGESDKDNGVSEGSLTGCASGYIIQYKNP